MVLRNGAIEILQMANNKIITNEIVLVYSQLKAVSIVTWFYILKWPLRVLLSGHCYRNIWSSDSFLNIYQHHVALIKK